jgi:hypothetical protein
MHLNRCRGLDAFVAPPLEEAAMTILLAPTPLIQLDTLITLTGACNKT